MTYPVVFHNTECLDCEEVHKEMVRVGVLVFCNKCYSKNFKTDDPIKKENGMYTYWLGIYKKKV